MPIAQITSASLVAGASAATDLLDPPRTARDGAVAVDFDIRRDLGRPGTRTLDRATALAVHAVGLLPGFAAGAEPDAATGIVLASTMGSIQSTMDFTRDSFTGAKPYHVDPARFPNTVMNFAAGQCAIRYGIQGPNATVTTGHVGSFTALAYAARLLRAGHAGRMVIAASEELSPERARLELAVGVAEEDLGEGAAALLVEPPGSSDAPMGEILRMGSAFAADPERVTPVLTALLDDLLAATGARPTVLAPRQAGPGSAELEALEACLGGLGGAEVLDTTAHTGDVGSAGGLVQLQAALAALARGADQDAVGVVTSTDREGAVHALLVRAGRSTA